VFGVPRSGLTPSEKNFSTPKIEQAFDSAPSDELGRSRRHLISKCLRRGTLLSTAGETDSADRQVRAETAATIFSNSEQGFRLGGAKRKALFRRTELALL
jgi:hypothetical protein